MWAKKHKTKWFFKEFKSELQEIFFDILFVYKNFIHWNISKVIISLWSILLWVIIFLPVFFFTLFIWWIDPINWLSILQFAITWSDISLELIGTLASNPFWLTLMFILLVCSFLTFVIAWSYGLFLLAQLSFGYVKRKPLKIKKNHYFCREYIVSYISIMLWNIVYLIAPVVILTGGIFYIYFLYNVWSISINVVENIALSIWVLGALLGIFFFYRLYFWFILLWKESKKVPLKSAKVYVNASIEMTKWKSFFKFLFILCLFVILMTPFNSLWETIEVNTYNMTEALAYKAGLIENMQPDNIPYYEYITQKYESYSQEQLVEKISRNNWISFFYSLMTYFLFSWLFVMIMVSYYKRVLCAKK